MKIDSTMNTLQQIIEYKINIKIYVRFSELNSILWPLSAVEEDADLEYESNCVLHNF